MMKELMSSDVYSISWQMFSNYLHDVYCMHACLKVFMRGTEPLILEETCFSPFPDLLNTYYRIANESYNSRLQYYQAQLGRSQQLNYQDIIIDINGSIIHKSNIYPLNRVKIHGQYLVINKYLSLLPAVSIYMQHDPDIIALICKNSEVLLETVH